MEIPCRGQTRGARARYTRRRYSNEVTPASLPGSHQRGALQEDSAVIQVWFEGDAAALAWVTVKASLRKPFVKGMTARNRDGDPLPRPDPRRAKRDA